MGRLLSYPVYMVTQRTIEIVHAFGEEILGGMWECAGNAFWDGVCWRKNERKRQG